MSARRHRGLPASESPQGVILVDYDNLVDALSARTARDDQPHRFLLAMVGELRDYLEGQMGLRSSRVVAFGDFTVHPVDAATLLRDLATSGLEARHISSVIHAGDAATALTIEAVGLVHQRSDIAAVVVLTGDRWYVPLVQTIQQAGRFALVAALDLPSNLSALHSGVGDAYLNARFLLDPRVRDSLSDADERGSARRDREAPAESIQDRAPKETHEVDDPGAVRALEVLEEYFGQYEEVYLTPLLRKLTESLDEEDGEPKDLVTLLQEAGAVWLEKRRGFPYDYTVLLVNRSHPDVLRAMETVSADLDRGGARDDYDDEEEEDGDYEEDAFDDDYDDDEPEEREA